MSTAQGNIFLTMENLAFSLPLIIVCSGYAFLKYVPMQYGIPIVGGIGILLQLRSKIRAQHAKKLQNMDEQTMADIARELEGDENGAPNDEQSKKLQKKKAAIERRLAAEKKKEEKQRNRKNKKGDDDDDDEDADLLATFAKGSRDGKQKKK